MSFYIKTYCTISVLDSFENGILSTIDSGSRQLIEPEYKQYVPANLLRRMNKVLKMGVSCGVRLGQDEELDGIVIGSGIGTYENSVQFTKHYLNKSEGALSPTTFIQSTDNTIAGQLALILNNYGYNNTYIHKGVAFENALLDAGLNITEGAHKMLVGGLDEWIDIFHQENETNWIAEGASFFTISDDASLPVKVERVWVLDNEGDISADVKKYLNDQKLDTPDLILFGNSFTENAIDDFQLGEIPTYNYSAVSGVYWTNSAFALQLACEILTDRAQAKEKAFSARKILIVNNFNQSQIGLTYVTSNE